jgi:beta-mannanase
VVLWLRSLKWLRPRTAKTLSWEMALFQLVRWPWALVGCGQALAGRIAGREFSFKVTPKARTGVAPLPIVVVLPYLVLAVASATPALLRLDAGHARGYYTLALINVGLYFVAAISILVLHIKDHPRPVRLAVLRRSSGKITLTVATALAVVGGIVAPGIVHGAGSPGGNQPPPWPIAGAPATPAIGVSTAALAENSTTPWTANDLTQVNAFEQTARLHASIVMWFADWKHGQPDLAQLRAIGRRGSIPEISWEPWDYTVGLRHPQPAYTLASIITGQHDAYIRAWAGMLRSYGQPVLLRFAQEMNGSWYPWSEGVNGNTPGQFVAAWRHVHDVFSAEHVTNVKWVWSPVARFGLGLNVSEYPGDAYVDVLGLSGFNGGTALPWTGWRSFSSLFDGALASLARISPGKPIQISEVGSAEAGGDKAAWIKSMFSDVRAHPQIKSLVWFDLRKQTDWRINSSVTAGRAFALAANAGARGTTGAAASTGSPSASADFTTLPSGHMLSTWPGPSSSTSAR